MTKYLKSVLFLAAGTLSLLACQREAAPAPAATLEGTWRLIGRQCYCSPAPVPNETLTFTDSTYRFAGTSQPLFASGRYRVAAVVVCGLTTPAPGLQFTDATANTAPLQAQYQLDGDRLTLNYGSPCDAPLDTYERVATWRAGL